MTWEWIANRLSCSLSQCPLRRAGLLRFKACVAERVATFHKGTSNVPGYDYWDETRPKYKWPQKLATRGQDIREKVADIFIRSLLTEAPFIKVQKGCQWSVVVLGRVGGYGQHLGEKRHWRKQCLWEESTHVPLAIRIPDSAHAGESSIRSVSLLDIYPTLIDLCSLPPANGLEETSLVPLLKDPEGERIAVRDEGMDHRFIWQESRTTQDRGDPCVAWRRRDINSKFEVRKTKSETNTNNRI